MTAKEKAKELVEKFLSEVKGADRYNYNMADMNLFIAKQCAIIAVKEIKEALVLYGEDKYEIQNMESYFRFWDNVEDEINKL